MKTSIKLLYYSSINKRIWKKKKAQKKQYSGHNTKAIVLTKACRATVSVMAKGCIVA